MVADKLTERILFSGEVQQNWQLRCEDKRQQEQTEPETTQKRKERERQARSIVTAGVTCLGGSRRTAVQFAKKMSAYEKSLNLLTLLLAIAE